MADIVKKRLWQSRIEECQNSSMSAKQWCYEDQVAYSTYLYWVKKFRLEAVSEQKVLLANPVFAQLPSEQDILNTSQKMDAPVSMPLGTIRIEISSSCPQNLLQSLIEVLNHYARSVRNNNCIPGMWCH